MSGATRRNPTTVRFGISAIRNFPEVPAHVLNTPNVQYAATNVTPSEGVWHVKKFKAAKDLQKWCIMSVDNLITQQDLEELSEMMISQGIVVGMNIAKPYITMYKLINGLRSELEEQLSKLKEMQLVVVVIPDESKIYNYVKQAAELSVGILTQCLIGKNICKFRLIPSAVVNMLSKINIKLNGVNHTLSNPIKHLRKLCMIMGAHVTEYENKNLLPCIVAVIASHDPQAAQYSTCWGLQPPRQIIIHDLTNMVKQHLTYYYKKNNQAKPECIILYRTGVGEDQFQAVLDVEVSAIRSACMQMQPDGNYSPKIMFIVLQKGHRTRFFSANAESSADNNFKVPAGTVVDTKIPAPWDFYLLSHACKHAGAKPTKYCILWDNTDMSADEVKELTYNLCHMCTRSPRSVNNPAPTMYACLVAARIRTYCRERQMNMNDLPAEQAKLVISPEITDGLPMFFI